MSLIEEYEELPLMIRRVAYNDFFSKSEDDMYYDNFLYDLAEEYPEFDMDEVSESDKENMYHFYNDVLSYFYDVDEEIKSTIKNDKPYLKKPITELKYKTFKDYLVEQKTDSINRTDFSDLFSGYLSLDEADIDELFTIYEQMFINLCVQRDLSALYSPEL